MFQFWFNTYFIDWHVMQQQVLEGIEQKSVNWQLYNYIYFITYIAVIMTLERMDNHQKVRISRLFCTNFTILSHLRNVTCIDTLQCVLIRSYVTKVHSRSLGTLVSVYNFKTTCHIDQQKAPLNSLQFATSFGTAITQKKCFFNKIDILSILTVY